MSGAIFQGRSEPNLVVHFPVLGDEKTKQKSENEASILYVRCFLCANDFRKPERTYPSLETTNRPENEAGIAKTLVILSQRSENSIL